MLKRGLVSIWELDMNLVLTLLHTCPNSFQITLNSINFRCLLQKRIFYFLLFWSISILKSGQRKKLTSHNGVWREPANQCDRFSQLPLACEIVATPFYRLHISKNHRKISIFFLSSPFIPKISKNQKSPLQEVLHANEHSVK